MSCISDMDTSSLNHCEVESCLKWKTSLPLERPHKSKAFWCQGIQRHFKFTINPQKFLYFLYLVSNHGDFKPFEATVNIEVLKKSIRIDKVYVRSASQNISCFHLDDVDPMSLSNCTSVTIAFLCPGDVDLKLFQNPSGMFWTSFNLYLISWNLYFLNVIRCSTLNAET